MKKIFSTLLIILIFSCAGENDSASKKETKFVGFYDLKGAVEFVNDIPVDTILNPDRRQTKFFLMTAHNTCGLVILKLLMDLLGYLVKVFMVKLYKK